MNLKLNDRYPQARLFRCIDLLQTVQNQPEELLRTSPSKPPPHMGLAGAADDYLPGMPGKPWKLVGRWADEMQPGDHAKTTDFKNHAAGIGKSVGVGTVY